MKKFSDIEVGSRFWCEYGVCVKTMTTQFFDGCRLRLADEKDEVDDEWWFYVETPNPIQLMQGCEDGAKIMFASGKICTNPNWNFIDFDYTFAPREEWREATKEDIGKEMENGEVLIWIAENHPFPYKTVDKRGSISSQRQARIKVGA